MNLIETWILWLPYHGELFILQQKKKKMNYGLPRNIIQASLVFAGIVDNISEFVQNGIVFSEKAVSHHGGAFTELFGYLESPIVTVPNGYRGFVDVDLRTDSFLTTGIDPFFDASRDVFFMLYTNDNREGQRISINNVGDTSFDKSNPVRVIIHGYLGSSASKLNTKITNAYLKEGNYNVIVTDWSAGAISLFYPQSRLRIEPVSVQIADLINFLIAESFTTYNQVIIIGHSLGGQTAGSTGKKIIGGKVSAIVALDPSGPLFPPGPTNFTLNSGDAQYVEVLHCNSGIAGILGACGHADFFPNGGTYQTGCLDFLLCPHFRCNDLFAESITNNNFVSKKCASRAEVAVEKCTDQGGRYLMGGAHLNFENRGIFFLKTAGSSPFALG